LLDQGKLTITGVQTDGNDPKANARAEGLMNRWLTDEINEKAEALGVKILLAHRSVHGDVLTIGTILEPFAFDDGIIEDTEMFRHEVVIGAGFNSNYKILSLEADAAALREMEGLLKEIGGALRNHFGNMKEITEPFTLYFNQNREFSLGTHSLSSANDSIIKDALKQFNGFFDNNDKKSSPGLKALPNKFAKLGFAMDKLHDPSLKNGVRFTL
jgi:hypothetical protein